MDTFKQILLRKAKIIGQLKYPQRSNRESILKYLKQIKKQEKQTQKEDLEVLKSLTQLSYEPKQLFEYFFLQQSKAYFLLFTVMKALCKKFEFIPEEKETFANIVEMNYKFYVKEGATEKAEQIRLIFRKKTFTKENFLYNLLSSLYFWGKTKLDKFLSKHILSIEKDLVADKLESPKKHAQIPEKLQNTSPLKNLLFQGTSMNFSYSEKLWKQQKLEKKQKQEFKIIVNGSENLFEESKEIFEISPFVNKQITEQADSFAEKSSERVQTLFEPERSAQLVPINYLGKQRSRIYNRDYLERSVNSHHLNKEIFYGTYWKEMHQIYKNFSILEDLDSYYLKTFKKQKEQRKEQLSKNRIDEVVQFMVKNMPGIKKSIQTYETNYQKTCPSFIKEFHAQSNKFCQQENKKKIQIKYLASKKGQKTEPHQKSKMIEKLKSEQNTSLNNLVIESPQKFNRKSVLLRSRQRNKSLNDALLRKSTQQKTQMQVKLPTVYNPQNFNILGDSETQKGLAIHQKYEKFLVNGARPNKGLARYKQINKERQKSTNDGSNIIEDKINTYENQMLQNRKQNEYEVANIRKILRKREKERLFVNKTPTFQTTKEDQLMQSIMIHIKAMDTKYTDGFTTKKVDKFDVFLNNFKNSEPIPFGRKTHTRSINIRPHKSSKMQIYSEHKLSKQEILPKI